MVFVCFPAWPWAAVSPRAGQRSWALDLVVSFQVMEQVETKRGAGSMGGGVELTTRKHRWMLMDGQPEMESKISNPPSLHSVEILSTGITTKAAACCALESLHYESQGHVGSLCPAFWRCGWYLDNPDQSDTTDPEDISSIPCAVSPPRQGGHSPSPGGALWGAAGAGVTPKAEMHQEDQLFAMTYSAF